MVKYKAKVEYLGTRYHGWQLQKGLETIQGALSDATYQITRERTTWVGAGRTDSGVHALAQSSHFVLREKPHAPDRLLRALNGTLPWEIRVRSLKRVPLDFHAQRQARLKRYEYRIFCGRFLSPFLQGRVFHCREELDAGKMDEAAALLRGTWDFSGFAAAASQVRTHVRTLSESAMKRRGRNLRYIAEGNGFLQHMVRNIVGTLLQVGTGRRPSEDILRILASRNRINAGPTAQPQGLYLVKVRYG